LRGFLPCFIAQLCAFSDYSIDAEISSHLSLPPPIFCSVPAACNTSARFCNLFALPDRTLLLAFSGRWLVEFVTVLIHVFFLEIKGRPVRAEPAPASGVSLLNKQSVAYVAKKMPIEQPIFTHHFCMDHAIQM
jgi:hypothetical protein